MAKNYIKLDGTTANKFQIEAAANGVQLKNTAGELEVLDGSGAASAVAVSSAKLVGTGATTTLKGSDLATVAYDFTLPVDPGVSGQVLSTDGLGNTSWINSASGATVIVDSTSFTFSALSTIPMFTLPSGAEVTNIRLIVDEAFDGTASVSVGTSAAPSSYMGSGDSNLSTALTAWGVEPILPPVGADTALEISYAAGGATAGAARVLVTYTIAA